MKLLIITQKIDKNDPILGFFVRWVEEFAKHCEKITVICLQKGEYDLPENVKVLSLGKERYFREEVRPQVEVKRRKGSFLEEKIFSRLKYIMNFYKYIWNEHKNYDSVFVHMNQEYILLGGLLWRALRKKIFLWRNHAKGNILTRVAVLFSNKVFCTSPQSFTARFKKTKIMPVGIDTDFFKPDSSVQKKPNSILFLGRIAPVKNVDIFIESLNELQKQGVEFTVTIAGASLPKDTEYEKMIRDKVLEYNLDNKVAFTGTVSQKDALNLYREHELYVNLTPSGSMDKTIFEAMACSVIPLVYNNPLKEILGEEFTLAELNIEYIVGKMNQILKNKKGRNFRDLVVEAHSLKNLSEKLFVEMK